MTDALGRVAREDKFDEAGRVVTSKDALGNITTNSYDAAGNLVGVQTNGLLAHPDWTLSDDKDADGLAFGWRKTYWTNYDDTATVTYAIEDQAQKVTISNHAAGLNGIMQDYNAGVYRGSGMMWKAAAGDVFTLALDTRQEGGNVVQFSVKYYDAAGAQLDYHYSPTYAPSAAWKRVTFTPKAAPANTAMMDWQIIFRTDATKSNGSAWFRLAHVEKGTSTTSPRTMGYDVLNRMTRMTSVGGLNVDLAYDSVGNRTRMVDNTGTTAYTYDAVNRVLSKTVQDGMSIRYEYDLASQLSKVTDFAGNQTGYTRDAAGRVTAATYSDGSQATFGYDAAGNRASLMLPGGLATSYTYDAANRISAMTNRNGEGQTLGSYSYTYDAAANLTSETDSKGTTTYTYDADNRLVSVSNPSAGTTSYSYDAVGNRTTMTEAAGTTTYTYNAANELTQETTPSGAKAYVWDKNGNLLNDGTAQYEYDSLNRLAAVTVQGKRVTYSYDGDGMMVSRTVGTETDRFYLDGQRVINEGDGAGTITASMFRGAGINLGRKVGSAPTAYCLYDVHGDVVGLSNSAGQLLNTYEYDAFGVLTASTGTFDNPYMYAGEYYDYTTGQYYLRARFYSPRTGRFISEDTYLGRNNDPMTLNLYMYVKGNPLKYVDPTGHGEFCLQVCDTSEGGGGTMTDHERLVAIGMTEDAAELFMKTPGANTADVLKVDGETSRAVVDEMNKAAPYVTSGQFASDQKWINAGLAAPVVLVAAPVVVSAAPAVAAGAKVVYVAAATSPTVVAAAQWFASNGDDAVDAVDSCTSGSKADCAMAAGKLVAPGDQPNQTRVKSSTAEPAASSIVAPRSTVSGPTVKTGEFSISDWTGYPGQVRPTGPFRILTGPEYEAARTAANKANDALHKANPSWKRLDIHEIHPVKFGGSPTDPSNKIVMTRSEHSQYTKWWRGVQRRLEK